MNLSIFVECVLEIKPVQEILCPPLQDVTCMSSPNNQPLLDVYVNNRNRMLTLIPVPLCTTSCISYFQAATNPNTLTPKSAATHSKDCL